MDLLIFGLFLWIAIHFVPTLDIQLRESTIAKIGLRSYRLLFALIVVIALLCIIFGWRSATPETLYQPFAGARHLTMLLMLFALLLFGAAKYPTRIKRFVRHPQLTGVALWSFAHLLANGDSRGLVLFGTMGLWALLEMVLINRRDGVWVKPEAPSWAREIRGAAISLTVYVLIVLFLHVYLSGIPLR